MSISFAGLSFEKTVNTRISTGSKQSSTRKDDSAPLTINVIEHHDKKTDVKTIKSVFKLSTAYSKLLNINGLVGDIIAGKPTIVMHPETETSKGKIFCFSEKAKSGEKSKTFKADVLLNTLKEKGLVAQEFGAVKGEKVELNLVDVSASMADLLPEGCFAWTIEAKKEVVEATVATETSVVDFPIQEEQEQEEVEVEDNDIY